MHMNLSEKSMPDRKNVGKPAIFLIVLIGVFFGQSYFFRQDEERENFPGLVTLGTSSSITTTLLMVAENEGFFRKEGLNIRIKLYKSAGLALDDMLAGNIEMAGVAETPIVHRAFDSSGFSIFATVMMSTNDPKIIVRGDAGVDKPADLAGKRIGVTKKYQSAHFFLHLFLLMHNIRPDDVAIVHDSPAAVVEQLNQGAIDAASLFEPYASYAADKLGEDGHIFAEPGIYTKTFNMAAKNAFLQNNPERIRRFLSALIMAENYIQRHPGEAIDLVSGRLSLDKEIINNYFNTSDLEVSLPGSLLISMRDQAQWIVKRNRNMNPTIPDLKKYIYVEALTAVKPETVTIEKEQ